MCVVLAWPIKRSAATVQVRSAKGAAKSSRDSGTNTRVCFERESSVEFAAISLIWQNQNSRDGWRECSDQSAESGTKHMP